MQGNWLSVLPPVLAIILAIVTRQVFISLFAGIWLGCSIIVASNLSGMSFIAKFFYVPLVGLRNSLESCIKVFEDGGNTKVIAFCALVGALIAFTQRSGGVQGFVDWISARDLVKSRKRAGLWAWGTGLLVFVESSITSLIVGSVYRPIYDRLKISREKLAYICDSTSAPVCILIPLNGWGAYIFRLLDKEHISNSFFVLLKSLPFNLYAIFSLIMVFFIIVSEKDFGPMAKAEKRAREEGKLFRDGAQPMIAEEITGMEPIEGIAPRARNMLIPVVVMIIMMPISLWITGDGHIVKGSGSTSVFWAVLAAIACGGLMYMFQGIMNIQQGTDLFIKGISGMVPLALLMVLAFAIGSICKELHTGNYVADQAKKWVSPALAPALLFLISGFIAFSTGTSWGTFAIMIPIGVSMIGTMDLHMSLTLGAVLSGGIFGDHCSPISDTTIISSMASACDHIDHVKTQLPYALAVGITALLCYVVFGFIL